jgi:hypothetical protein
LLHNILALGRDAAALRVRAKRVLILSARSYYVTSYITRFAYRAYPVLPTGRRIITRVCDITLCAVNLWRTVKKDNGYRAKTPSRSNSSRRRFFYSIAYYYHVIWWRWYTHVSRAPAIVCTRLPNASIEFEQPTTTAAAAAHRYRVIVILYARKT